MLAAVLIPTSHLYGQAITAVSNIATTDKIASDQEAPAPAKPEPAKTEPAKPDPTPEPDFWHREKMTGDWGGDRERLKNEGLEMDVSLTQFFQGTASGGLRHDSEYNGKFEFVMKLDFGKMSPKWQWWSSEIKFEWRFGGPILGGTGAINPVNTGTFIPASDGSVASISAVNFTRLIPIDLKKGNLFAISFGRYNLVDLVEEDFFAGSGTERFFNLAQIGPLTVLREVPLITNAVNFAYIKGGEPFITFSVMDPNDHSLDWGLDDLFKDGVTLAPGINFPTKYWGKSGKHTFGGAVTTKKYTPFDPTPKIATIGSPTTPLEPKRGSWSVSYVFRQYIVERGPKDGWGLFSQIAFANKDTSPVTKFFDVGLGGNGLIKSRRRDEFGIAYAYTDLSSVLKDRIDLLPFGGRRLLAEHQVEMFYNLHITPWLRLTGDLQVIRPVRGIADTAVVPGARLQVVF
jgi:porin